MSHRKLLIIRWSARLLITLLTVGTILIWIGPDRLGDRLFGSILFSCIGLTAGGLLAICVVLRCPRCGISVMWYEMKKPMHRLFRSLFVTSLCPACGASLETSES
jgi:endogenous inhibitor of DNA gyrase (YacG/DUF329 family)